MNKKNVYLMYAITFLQGIVIYATIATLYREARGLNLSEFALIESFSYFFTLAFEIPFGFIADRIGYRKTLILSNLFYFVSKYIFYIAYGFNLFLLERLFMSIAIAGLSGVDSSILYLSSGEDNSHKTFGLYSSFGTAGMLLGSMVFTLFLSRNYAGCAFYTMIAYGVAFILSFFVDEVKEKQKEEKPTVKRIVDVFKVTGKDYKFVLFLLGVALIMNSSWTVMVMLNQDKYLSLGINEQMMGIIAMVIYLVTLLSAYSSKLTKTFGQRRFVLMMSTIMALFSLLMGYTKIAYLAVISNIVVELTYGLMMPLFIDLENKRVSVEDRASQLSVYAMIIDIASIGLSLITSYVAGISFEAMYIMCVIEAMIAIVLINQCYKKVK